MFSEGALIDRSERRSLSPGTNHGKVRLIIVGVVEQMLSTVQLAWRSEMSKLMVVSFVLVLAGLLACSETTHEASQSRATKSTKPESRKSTMEMSEEKTDNGWAEGDTIDSGNASIPAIRILKVHNNGEGPVCGTGKMAKLKYKAMLANGSVLDPGTRPFEFRVGGGQAIKGWDIVVAKMRVGDSFTILLPQDLAYGPSKGDLMFDMQLLSVR